ncbi:DNA replication and repair protein RecF [Oxobacter pfennigii]|uniref:DNA replication and repair protein RecF n=1 Tax=Oxobacter pfennigii TaxID=36849 RepID=A0A0N8NTZ7_9CLOT|nr:AAA family ATPase [Oxobacter pfennigii]KPU46224.1 DNA replication and repair protein RecF [Oxobacter pfennigii]
MKFKSIKAKSFGCLEDWESPEITQDIIVVYGNNEAGKSTVFNMINTLIYGWNPASRDLNPYIPWGQSQGECSAGLTLNDGSTMEVNRRLKSTAEGKIIKDEKLIPIGNNAIEGAEYLPRQVFDEIYSITLEQLRFPHNSVWQKVQDQLLGGQYASFIQPVSKVISKLVLESNSLWRPDRHGNPMDKKLKEELKELNKKLTDSLENEKRISGISKRLDEIKDEISDIIERKSRLIFLMDKTERLHPVKKKLQNLKELNEKAEGAKNYDFLPQNPREELKRLDIKTDNLDKKLKEAVLTKNETESKLDVYSPLDKLIYENRDKIKLAIKSYGQNISDINAASDLSNGLLRFKDRIVNKAKECLQGGWTSESLKALKAIDEAELRAGLSSFKKANYNYKEHNLRMAARKSHAQADEGIMFYIISALLIIIGLTSFVLSTGSLIKVIFALVFSTGIITLYAAYSQKSKVNKGSGLKEEEKQLRKLDTLREEALNKVKASLKGLNIAALRLEEPDDSLLVDVNTLKSLLNDWEEIKNKKDIIDKRLSKGQQEISVLLNILSLKGSGDILSTINMLDNLMDKAEENYNIHNNCLARLNEIQKAVEEIQKELKETIYLKEEILKGIQTLDGENNHEKLLKLEELRDFRQRAHNIKGELEREYIGLEGIIEEINKLSGQPEFILDEESLARAKAEREQLDNLLNNLNMEAGSKLKEMEQRQEERAADDIKGEIESLEILRKRNAIERDRLQLMKNIIAFSDRKFRDENQPDILLRAGKYLETITGGRYDRLYILEDTDTYLEVRLKDTKETIDVNKALSRGTKEQIYLSLRLGLLDHLDDKKESFPLFLDEALVNWDSFRLNNVLTLLKDISKKRQVFIFTCHKWFKDILEKDIKGQVINL